MTQVNWFHINQFLLFLLNAVFIVEKYQIPILHLIGPDRSSNSHFNLHFEYHHTCLSSTDIISSNCNIKQQHSLKVKVEGHISKYCILWWSTTIFVTRHYKIKSKKYTRYYIFDITEHILYQITFMNKWNIKFLLLISVEPRLFQLK
jgi:hypothetical protein